MDKYTQLNKFIEISDYSLSEMIKVMNSKKNKMTKKIHKNNNK